MNDRVLTNSEIIEKLISITNSKSAADLARKLGTERQNLKSYQNKTTNDLNNKIISLLIEQIEDQKSDH